MSPSVDTLVPFIAMWNRLSYALLTGLGIALSRYLRNGFEGIDWPRIGIYSLLIFCVFTFLPQRMLKLNTPENKLRAIRTTLVLSFLHLTTFFATLAYSATRVSMIEQEEGISTTLDGYLSDILQVLGFPILQFLEEHISPTAQWLLISLNSILWGIVIYSFFALLFRRKAHRRNEV